MRVTIYDMRGAVVRTIHLGDLAAGDYTRRGDSVHWNGQNDRGEQVAGGVYMYEIEAAGESVTRRMVVGK